MKFKALMLLTLVALAGCSPAPERQAIFGTALNVNCEDNSCYIIVSSLDGWGIRRTYELPTCDDNRAFAGQHVMAFQRVQDNRICWKVYADK